MPIHRNSERKLSISSASSLDRLGKKESREFAIRVIDLKTKASCNANMDPASGCSSASEINIKEPHYARNRMEMSFEANSQMTKNFGKIATISKGGFGTVVKVKHKIDNCFYAIKCILLNQKDTESNEIMKEVELLSPLIHDNIVRYFGTWIDDCSVDEAKAIDDKSEGFSEAGSFLNSRTSSDIVFQDESNCFVSPSKSGPTQVLCIQMEFCKKTLADVINFSNLYKKQFRAWKIFWEIVQGLAYLNEKGVIHRDLKPQNIFLDIEDRVKIGDFGLATKIFRGSSTKEHIMNSLSAEVGTSFYRAPELNLVPEGNRAKYGQEVDIYSLGIILFEMFHPPFSTGSERYHVLTDLRKQEIIMPKEFMEDEKNAELIPLIRLLLNHDANARLTCADLLSMQKSKQPTNPHILRRIPMETGVSKPVLEHLRKIANSYGDDKYCLLFDEMAIKPRLNYNRGKDEVDGFTDLGNSERTNTLADHALVFMLQGIRRKFKQPLAYYFVRGTIASAKLATIIKNIIRDVNAAGFKIVATICDQGATNLGALEILKESLCAEECPLNKNYFNCNDEKIYTIFDVPHLFTSIWNDFLNTGQILMNGKKVKWEQMKKVEESNRNQLYLSKISETHINSKYRAKMKVKYVAQTLSNTVAAVLKLLARDAPDPQERQELIESGELIHDLDWLFDITNGPAGPNDVKIGQRENVSNKTNHLTEWAEYRKKLETLKFIKSNGTTANVKCVQGYLTTLCSFRDLWVDLRSLGFKCLNLRQLNQDALENFFGLLRHHSPTNRNPTVSSFVAALKTSVISGVTEPHSRGSNCEEDSNVLLTNLQNFGDLKTSVEISTEEDEGEEVTELDNDKENRYFQTDALPSIPDDEEEIESSLLNLQGQAVVYVSGYIAMRICRTNECHVCKNSLTTSNPGNDPTFSYIQLREWCKDREHLTYPTIGLCKYVESCVKIFENEVIPALHRDNICVFATTLFMTSYDASFIKCNLHGSIVLKKMSSLLAFVLIRRQCQRMNQYICTRRILN